jgi:acetyl esterase/lipase
MGKLPDTGGPQNINVIYRDSLHTDWYTRYLIAFSPAGREEVTAYLYIPKNSDVDAKLPAMIVLHGTGALGKRLVDGESPLPNRAQAKELAKRGYVVIAPDYPSMGEQENYDFHSDRYVSGTMKGIFNHIRCLDLLTQLEKVDKNRIGALGHSLGGHNAMFLGAFDERVKVVVSSSGWTLFDYYNIGDSYGGRLGPWAQDRYMPYFRTKYQLDGSQIPFDFDDIIASIAPRAFFSNSPLNDSNFDVEGVKKGIENARKVYRYMNVEGNLQVRYPEAEHDFPTSTRRETYEFIDMILEHIPNKHTIE